jgi:type III restriction enzyme
LITLAAKAMKEMPETKKPSVRSTKNEVVMGSRRNFRKIYLSDTIAPDYGLRFEIPDMLAYIQGKTELTRSTILDIVKKSDKISELLINPQMFMDNTTSTIKSVCMN